MTLTLAWGLMAVNSAIAETSGEESERSSIIYPASLQDLVMQALSRNPNIQIAQSGVRQAGSREDLEEAMWVPNLRTRASYREFSNIQNQFDPNIIGPDTFGLRVDDIRRRDLRVDINQALPTGGRFLVVAQHEALDNSLFDRVNGRGDRIYPFDETFTTRAYLQVVQPLLKGAGYEVTTTKIQVAALGSKIADLQFRKTLNDQLARLSNLYYQHYAAKTERQLLSDVISLAGNRQRTTQDPNQKQVYGEQIKKWRQAAAKARRTERNLENQMYRMVTAPDEWKDNPPEDWFSKLGPPPTAAILPEKSPVADSMLMEVPDLKIASLQVDQARMR